MSKGLGVHRNFTKGGQRQIFPYHFQTSFQVSNKHCHDLWWKKDFHGLQQISKQGHTQLIFSGSGVRNKRFEPGRQSLAEGGPLVTVGGQLANTQIKVKKW